MDILILAETPEKVSYQEKHMTFFRQYAIAHDLSLTERDAYWKAYRMDEIFGMSHACITMSRRVDNRSGELSYWEWDVYDCFEGLTMAANRFADTAYYKANSKHPLHVEAVKRQKRYEELTREHSALLLEKTSLGDVYQRKYQSELIARRLWKKSQRNEAPQNIVDEIKENLRKELNADKERIDKRLAEILSEMKEL